MSQISPRFPSLLSFWAAVYAYDVYVPFVCERGFLFCSGSSEVSPILHAEGVKLQSREMNFFAQMSFFFVDRLDELPILLHWFFFFIVWYEFNANWIDNELYPT